MTPRQLFAWFRLGAERFRRERAAFLHDLALGSQGKPEAIERTITELEG